MTFRSSAVKSSGYDSAFDPRSVPGTVGYRKFWSAVINMAVRDIVMTSAPGAELDLLMHFQPSRDAICWIFAEDQRGPRSFNTICEATDHIPSDLRNHLRYREKRLAMRMKFLPLRRMKVFVLGLLMAEVKGEEMTNRYLEMALGILRAKPYRGCPDERVERRKVIVMSRLFDEPSHRTYASLGEEFGITRARVQQIERKARVDMKKACEAFLIWDKSKKFGSN